MIQNERHIEAQEQKLDSYTGRRDVALSGALLIRSETVLTISTAVYETVDIKATTLANGIMSGNDIIY